VCRALNGPVRLFLARTAYVDGNGFGVTFDGSDDFMAISPTPRGFNSRDFSISFWFTRTQCTVPGGCVPRLRHSPA
jgi:hypothetical protein